MSDDRRYLMRSDGAPFFYLGDTAWELLHRCTLTEIEHYLRDRASKGFTVVQTVILAEIDGLRTPNAQGHLPLHDEDPTRPNEDYFRLLDATFDLAESLDLTIGLLPTWGDKWNQKWGTGPEVFTPDSARIFGEYVGRRYAERDVIWILGGDRPTESAMHEEIIRSMAAGVRAGDGGRNLMTAHVWGQHSTTEYFGDETWLDFHTVQSGHERNFENWRMIRADLAREPGTPCIDLEPAYEEAPNAIGDIAGGFIDEYEVRKGLYWSLFAGAAGHTYGCWPVWQMWDSGRDPRMWVRRSWREALQAPGAGQMRHAKDLLLSRPYFDRIPDQSLVTDGDGPGAYHVAATRDREGTVLMAYIPAGQSIEVDLSVLAGPRFRSWWFDPRTGSAQRDTAGDVTPRRRFSPPAGGPDWVLVIDSADVPREAPGRSYPYVAVRED
ncbi:glycoside hydrolase family 140 protein [Microbacterium sp. NPDC089696]|uniref:glycoside hydrolase family 140 protein n=1 Tax=Microbacterium sp. NPDC089696 TaxID=3364199 RepID=UPI0037F3C235